VIVRHFTKTEREAMHRRAVADPDLDEAPAGDGGAPVGDMKWLMAGPRSW